MPQFGSPDPKDMLNRNIYKRIGHDVPLKLATDLKIRDKEILLEDASTLATPDKASKIPGIISPNGERIEYLTQGRKQT